MQITELQYTAGNLDRPECIVATSNGRLYVSDFRGGVTVIEPDGRQKLIKSKNTEFDLKPNGILLEKDGTFLIAHLGDREGGIYRLHPDGSLDEVLLKIENEQIPPTNFVHRDNVGRIWITVSTRLCPRSLGYRGDNRDGFIICVDAAGARIAADNLGYTNECLVDPSGTYLYVNETFTKELSRFEIGPDNSLKNRKVLYHFDEGEFPDGMALDRDGGIWIACIVANRLVRIDKNLQKEIIVDDSNKYLIEEIESVYRKGQMDASHMKKIGGSHLKSISSLAFGGKDMKTIYMGCLLGKEIPFFKTSIPGEPLPWWNFEGPKI